MTTDRIEKTMVIRAPRSRVWRALTRSNEFGEWFRVKLDGEFVEGTPIHGKITHPGFEHLVFDLHVERIEAESYFALRWHPYAIDPSVDYSLEPMTLIEFRLKDVDGGTELSVVESGFDRIPLARRVEAFRMNDQGWTQQVKNIDAYVTSQ